MMISTKAYGRIDIDERQRFRFPEGLFGFEKFKDFALLDAPQKPFFYLQSTELSELAFVLIDPFLFRPDYSIDVSDASLRAIGVESREDALVFAIVTVPPEGGPITANLMGPVVACKTSRQAIQAVLSDPRWLVKHDIMAELAAARS